MQRPALPLYTHTPASNCLFPAIFSMVSLRFEVDPSQGEKRLRRSDSELKSKYGERGEQQPCEVGYAEIKYLAKGHSVCFMVEGCFLNLGVPRC